MANTIEQLITRVETRLSLAAGLDVQIHAEDRLVEMIRHKYNALFDEYWLLEHTYFMTCNLDGTTGQITEDIEAEVDRFKDIYAVFYNTDDTPLPRVGMSVNPSRIRTRSVLNSSDAAKVFKIYPIDTTGQVHIWYRKRIKASEWDEQDYTNMILNFDDEILFLGVMYEFLVTDGSNPEAAQMYGQAFAARRKQLEDERKNIPIGKRPLEQANYVTDWQ